jgi:hypothetical protein
VLTEHGIKIAPSTYYARVSCPVSAAELGDAYAANTLVDLYRKNRRVYGVRKLWHTARRAGHPWGRDQVGRLMAIAGIDGVRRGRHRAVTTQRDQTAPRHPDLCDRAWASPTRPDEWWVADFTYVWTLAGFVYVSFVTDVYSRRILGWRVSTAKTTPLVMSALEQALFTRRRGNAAFTATGLLHHSDAGSQGGLNRSSQHPVITEVFDGATSAASGSGFAARDALTEPADAGQACGAQVLALDRAGKAHGGRRARARRVHASRVALVSPRWRHAAAEPGRAHRPLPVVPRARGTRPAQGEGSRGPGDRS